MFLTLVSIFVFARLIDWLIGQTSHIDVRCSPQWQLSKNSWWGSVSHSVACNAYSQRAEKQNLKFSLTRWHTNWLRRSSRLSLHSDKSVCWVSHIFLKVPAGLLLLCSDELLMCDLLMWQRSRFARILTHVLPPPGAPAPSQLSCHLGSCHAFKKKPRRNACVEAREDRTGQLFSLSQALPIVHYTDSLVPLTLLSQDAACERRESVFLPASWAQRVET